MENELDYLLDSIGDDGKCLDEKLDSEEYQVRDAEEVLDEIVGNASECLMQTSLVDDSDCSAIVGTYKGVEDVKVDLETDEISDSVTATVYTSNFEAAKSAAENLDTDTIDYSLKELDDQYQVRFKDV